MRLNRCALAAAALALCGGCGGSLPPPVTQPDTTGHVATSPVGTAGVGVVQTPAPATASISGTIRRADTSQPLARARVIVTSEALQEPRAQITGAAGTYEFGNLPPGAYAIAVSRTGFAPQQFGERRAAPAATVPVAIGQKLTGIDVALAPAGVIVGTILDEDGQPFSGARIDALVSRAENNQSTLVSVASAESDDKGAFRLTGLPEGQYYVSALDPAFSNVGDETGPLTYTATYYPGTPYVEQATRVTVVPGVEPTVKVSFTLKIIRPARVAGRLSTIDKRQLISGAVIMSPAQADTLAAIPARDVFILPDGTFGFRNVPAGRYQIRARGETDPDGVMLFAMFSVAVEGRDINDLALMLTPGGSVEGRMYVEAVSTPRPATFHGVRIRAPFIDGTSFGDALTGDVAADGAYRIRGLMPGSHYVTVEGLPYPWVLKRVMYKGQDITDIGLDVESRQEFRDVRVTITDVTTDISGTVTDGDGRDASAAMVLMIPASQQFWSRTSRRFGLVRTDAGGRYRIRGLPAGEYRAVATYDVDESEAYRHGVLQDLIRHAVPVSVADRERRTVDLPLLSLTAARRTATR